MGRNSRDTGLRCGDPVVVLLWSVHYLPGAITQVCFLRELLVDSSLRALAPLFYQTPVELGFPPSSIGDILGASCILDGRKEKRSSR